MSIPTHVANLLRTYISDTYVGEWPGSVTNAVAVRVNDGSNHMYFDKQTQFSPLVQFLIRHEHYAPGYDWCKAIKALFHGHRDDKLQMILVGDILHLGRNADRLHEFQMTFKTIIKE